MPTLYGKDARGKIIKVKPYPDEGGDRLLWLTDRQRGLLLAMTEYLDWKTRWETLPAPLDDDDERDAYVSDLKNRLMIMVDFCELMIGCIDEDADVRKTLTDFILSTTGNLGDAGGYGTPMSNTELSGNLAQESNPACDFDVLFAQCRFIVKQTHEAVIEVLQDVELTSNAFEIAKNLWDSVPVIGATDDAAGANGWINMALYWQEAVNETYEAQWDETIGGIYDKLSYRLFCLCRADCIINIDRIIRCYEDALSEYIAPPSLSGLTTLLALLAGLDQETTFVVELAHYVAWGLVKLIRFLFGRKYDDFIGLAIRLKADEPDNDWETLETLFGACPTEICMTPIIYASAWGTLYPANQGTNIQEVVGEDCYYTIDATTGADTVERIVFEEEIGQEFIIEDISYPNGITTGTIFYRQDGSDFEASGTPSILSNITRFGIGFQSGTLPGQIKFKMYRIG